MKDHQPPSRSRTWFSLATMLIGVTLLGLGLGTARLLGWEVVAGFSGLAFSLLLVVAVIFCLWPLASVLSRRHGAFGIVIAPILYGVLGIGFLLFGVAIDQPHPIYANGNWFTVHWEALLPMFCLFAMGGMICVGPDAISTANRLPPFPDFGVLRRALSLRKCRLLLIAGLLLILAYYAISVVEIVIASEGRSGTIWPPPRVLISCALLWGLFWLVERSSRNAKWSLAAPIVFMLLCLTLLPGGVSVMRE